MLSTIILGLLSNISSPSISNNTMPIAPIVAPMVIPATMPYDVPLYSQITDITSVEWKQKGCGVTDVAMIVNFYKPRTTTAQDVLEKAISLGAYQKNVGWKHDGLAALAKKYDLIGKTYNFSDSNNKTSFKQFKDIIEEGPAIASIHRGFDPKSSFGHLVVITGFDKDLIYYNDPGKHDGIRKVSIVDFMKGWKKVLIVIRPPSTDIKLALAQ